MRIDIDNIRVVILALIYSGIVIVVYENVRMLASWIFFKSKPCIIRRIITWGLILVLTVCVIDAYLIEPNWIQISRIELKTDKLEHGEKIRVLQISDIHTDIFGYREKRMFELAKSVEPDIILLTGDYVSGRSDIAKLSLLKVASGLVKIAPVYYVYGNWDTPLEQQIMDSCGAKFASHQVITVKSGAKFLISEVPWFSNFAPPYTLDDNQYFKVLLCHTPQIFDAASLNGTDLVLSGHTHGGQVRLPLIGALLPKSDLVGKYQMGIYKQKNSIMYVNRGLGMTSLVGPGVRFICRPEVAIFDVVGTK